MHLLKLQLLLRRRAERKILFSCSNFYNYDGYQACGSHTLPDCLRYCLLILKLVKSLADGAFACCLQNMHTT